MDPPINGQSEFCGNLIIESPGESKTDRQEDFPKMLSGKGLPYSFPRDEPVTLSFHTNE